MRCFKWYNFFALHVNQHLEYFSISELQIRQKIRGSFYAKPRIFHFHNGKNGWLNSINKSSEKNYQTVPVYCKLAWKATSIGNFPHNHDENKINRTRWKISRYTVKIEISQQKMLKILSIFHSPITLFSECFMLNYQKGGVQYGLAHVVTDLEKQRNISIKHQKGQLLLSNLTT